MSTYDVTRRDHSPHLEVWKVDDTGQRIALYLDDDQDALAFITALRAGVPTLPPPDWADALTFDELEAAGLDGTLRDVDPFWRFVPTPGWLGITLQQGGHRHAYWSMDWPIAVEFANAILAEANKKETSDDPSRG